MAAGVAASGRPGSERSFFAFLVPNLAAVAACVSLFYCLFLFQGYQKLFRDSDSGWHIRTGEVIVSTGALPRTDPYSFTRAGEPWFAWEWGADVAMGLLHRTAGLAGVAMLYAVAIAFGVWLWFRLHWAVGGDFLIAAAMAPLMLSTCNIHWLARPHVLSWLFLEAAVWFAVTVPSRPLLTAAVFTALWANIHASFFFAPLIALIFAAGEALRPLIWAGERGNPRRWFGIAVAAAAGSLLNPYGWHLHRHLFAYVTNSELLRRVGEFQSFDFHAEGATQIIAAVMIAMLGAAAALARRQVAWFLVSLLLVASGLRTARTLPIVALICLPLANGAISGVLRETRLRLPLHRFFAYSSNLRRLDARHGGLIWLPLLAAALFPLLPARAGFPADQFPVAAAAQLEKLPPAARLLAPDKFGGYLIYRFQGRIKVFFDGRSDLYGAAFLKDYGQLAQVRPGWREQVAAFGFTHALLPNGYSLVPALEQAGWVRLYRDHTATLLARQYGN
ncbi:MAG: hypothetical protein ACE15B_07995 [Bryobacteraceae bacterium]